MCQWVFLSAKFFPRYHTHLAKSLKHPENNNLKACIYFNFYLSFSLCLLFVANKPGFPLKLSCVEREILLSYNNKSSVWFLWEVTIIHQKRNKKIHISFQNESYQYKQFYILIFPLPPKTQDFFLSSFRICSLGVFSPWDLISNQLHLL